MRRVGSPVHRYLANVRLAAVLLALAGCGAEPSPDGAVAAWSLSPEPRVVVGQVEGDERYLFQSIADAALLPDGRVVVADRGLAALRIYDGQGLFVREMGRRGEGPGEFTFLREVEVVPPDTIYAYDARVFRMAVFLTDGGFLATRPITADDGFPEIFMGRFDDGDLAMAWITQVSSRDFDRPTPDPMKMARFSPDGDLEAVLGVADGMIRFGSGPIPFSPFFHADVHGDSVYFTNGLTPEITVLDRDGNRVGTIRTPPTDVAPDAAWRMLEAEVEAREDARGMDRLASVPRSDSIPHIADMFIDTEGRVWAKRYVPEEDALMLGAGARGRGGEWWVMRRSGEVIATVPLPDDLIPLDAGPERLVGMRRNELDVHQLVVYDIVR